MAPRRVANPAELLVWACDLLALDGKDLRRWSLERRQARLQALVSRFACPVLLHSEAFDDGQALLRVAEKHGLEGVVSKRLDAPYRSGACRAAAGARSKRPLGVRRTGSVGDCLRCSSWTRNERPCLRRTWWVRPIQTNGIGAGTTIRLVIQKILR
jgi:hypothetical protein